MECILIVALVVIACLGYCLWVVAGWFHRTIFHETLAPADSTPEACARCGKSLDLSRSPCRSCGLDPRSSQAAELRELEAAARLVQKFQDQGSLDPPACERVYRAIEERQLVLLKGDAAASLSPSAPVAAPPPAPAAAMDPPASVPLVQEIERLLTCCRNVSHLPFVHKRQVLSWYPRIMESGLRELSAQALLALAELLWTPATAHDALRVARCLLERYTELPAYGRFALRAGRFAVAQNLPDQAVWFLEKALKLSRRPEVGGEAWELLRELRRRHQLAGAEEVLEVIALEEPDVAVPAVVAETGTSLPPAPRRTLGEMLAGFMEEKNILWGELAGGILIVGCSIALVISLWRTLEQIPYFPFLVVAGFTAGLFSAGFYTLSHWKLESTSRGLLVIGTLLVPLDFLVLAGLTRAQAGGGLEIVIDVFSLAGFAWLVYRAARVLMSPGLIPEFCRADWLLPVAVLGAAGSQLCAPRLLDVPGAVWRFGALGFIPAACHAIAVGSVLRGLSRRPRLERQPANALFVFLGLATFALAVTLGFFLSWSADPAAALQYLSMPIALAGVPILVCGAMVHRGVEDVSAPWPMRMIGGTIAVAGLFVLTGAVVLAWPLPAALVATAGLSAAVLSAVALRYRLPILHPPALACLTIGYLTAFHWLSGGLALPAADLELRLLAVLSGPRSGAALTAVVVFLCISAEILIRTGRRLDGTFHAAGAGFVTALSLTLVTLEGIRVPERAFFIYAAYGIGCLAINARWRRPALSRLGSIVLLGAAIYALVWLCPTLEAPRLLFIALLIHATVMLLLGRALEWALPGGAACATSAQSSTQTIFILPLRQAVLTASGLAWLTLLFVTERSWMLPLSLCTAWLAALWLALSVWTVADRLFTAAQAVFYLAVLFGVTAWLDEQPWIADATLGLLDPRGLQAYGVGWSILCFFWTATRIIFRENRTVPVLLNPPWPSVDRVLLGFLVVGQFGLALWGAIPGIFDELIPIGTRLVFESWPDEYVFGPGAWYLLGLLAVVLALALWDREPEHALLGLVGLALTAPLLTAGWFRDSMAVASGLRWGLALCFLFCSAFLWARSFLSDQLTRVGIRFQKDNDFSGLARWLPVCDTIVPLLVLTVTTARLDFAGSAAAPLKMFSGFLEIGRVSSLVLPLVFVCFGLTGHGMRERASGYLFAAGLTAATAVMGGYALSVVNNGGTIDTAAWVCILQLGTVSAAIWAILWRAGWSWMGSAWVNVESDRRWLLAQLCLGGAGNLCLVGTAGWLLLVPLPPAGAGTLAANYPAAPPWTLAAGAAWGWAALLLSAGAVWLRQRIKEISPFASANTQDILVHVGGLFGLLFLGLLACSTERFAPGWGYRVFLTGCGTSALFHAWRARRSGESITLEAKKERFAACAHWIRAAGGLTVLLGLKAAFRHQDPLWAAGSLILLSGAFALFAGRLRRESWMFVAGLGLNLAVSLVVWDVYRPAPLSGWWVALGQANLIVAGLVALLWLHGRESFYDDPELRISSSPYLAGQAALGLLGNGLLLLPPLVRLLAMPAGPLTPALQLAGKPAGWLALLLSAWAAVGYIRRVQLRGAVHVLGCAGMLLGVQAACTASLWNQGWLAHHVLTCAWSLLGLALLAAGWTGSSASFVGPVLWSADRRARAAALLKEFFPVDDVRRWVEAIGILVIVLALRGAWNDPGRPYSSSAATLAVSALFGALAVWTRRPAYVYLSGLLINVVGFIVWQGWLIDEVGVLVWMAWGPGILDRFVAVNILCLASASCFWTVLEAGLRRCTPPVDLRGPYLPFSHCAALVALQLLAILVLSGFVAGLTGEKIEISGLLPWLALWATVGAFALCLWDPDAPRWSLPYPQLFAAGLLTIGLFLHGRALPPARLGWAMTTSVAGYVLAMTILAAFLCKLGFQPDEPSRSGFQPDGSSRSGFQPDDPSRLGFQPDDPSRARQAKSPTYDARAWFTDWFLPAQVSPCCVVAMLSTWVSIGFDAWPERLAGPLSAALVLAAVVLWTLRAPAAACGGTLPTCRDLDANLRHAALAVGVLLTVELSWIILDPAGPAPWLQRNGMLFAVLVFMGTAYGSRRARWVLRSESWCACAKALGPWLGTLACLALVVLVAQEMLLYDAEARRVPLPPPIAVADAVALLLLSAGAIRLAISPERDPFGLPDRRRALYVYGAEFLLAFFVLHLRLNKPDWIPFYLGRYWMLVVMVLAFAGAGLSELFDRRGRQVLSVPLGRSAMLLPFVPLLAYVLRLFLVESFAGAGRFVPGFMPLARMLERMPGHYSMHALLWFLLGLLYALTACGRRSARCAFFSGLAVNFGLWVVWANHERLAFLLHPQLWLILPALLLLSAEHYQRPSLGPRRSLGLRYAGLLLLYVSSSADMFITGLGNSVLLPVVLALLSVLGVLAGILLRVQAFLSFGMAFLFVVIFAQIWHAAVDREQTWVWWASGIVLGAAILTLFALFEKRRNDLLKLFAEIRTWA